MGVGSDKLALLFGAVAAAAFVTVVLWRLEQALQKGGRAAERVVEHGDMALCIAVTLLNVVVTVGLESLVALRGLAIVPVASTLVVRVSLLPSSRARTLWVGLLLVVPAAGFETGYGAADGLHWCITGAVLLFTTDLLGHESQRRRMQSFDGVGLGKYSLEGVLGEGSMGRVYLGLDSVLRRRVAIKVLSAPVSRGDALNRFEREIRVLSTVNHPHVVCIYDYGFSPDGSFYYVMERIPGRTLEQELKEDGALPLREAVEVLLQLASAIAFLHEKGLIHGDIKPGNVMVDRSLGFPMVKVVDFGLAVPPGQLGEADDSATLLGTPAYCAPEQVLAAGRRTRASDVYGFGACAFALFNEGPPVMADSVADLCRRKLKLDPRSLDWREVPEKLRPLLMACLGRGPQGRPSFSGVIVPTLHEVAASLREGPSSRPPWGYEVQMVIPFSERGATTPWRRRSREAAHDLLGVPARGGLPLMVGPLMSVSLGNAQARVESAPPTGDDRGERALLDTLHMPLGISLGDALRRAVEVSPSQAQRRAEMAAWDARLGAAKFDFALVSTLWRAIHDCPPSIIHPCPSAPTRLRWCFPSSRTLIPFPERCIGDAATRAAATVRAPAMASWIAALENARLRRAQYEQGVGTEREVLDALNDISEAELEAVLISLQLVESQLLERSARGEWLSE
ncbi:MAG: serine/threonine-protein kinase [Myxococcota bacterium]